MSNQLPKIYTFINSDDPQEGWMPVVAVSEDGEVLASHVSTNLQWALWDIGMTSGHKHRAYEARYPEGYQLEWVDDPQAHAGVQAAFKLNQQRVPTP